MRGPAPSPCLAKDRAELAASHLWDTRNQAQSQRLPGLGSRAGVDSESLL